MSQFRFIHPRHLFLTAVSFMLLFVPSRASQAELCSIDQVPAATLLVPYFAVDFSMCGETTGLNTLVRIQNTDAAPAIAHVVLWTDWSIPTFAFDISLTGYDVETIDLKKLFCSGVFPSDNTTSGTIEQETLAHLQAWHGGNESPMTNSCASSPRQDNLTAGYITIDNANQSGLGFPSAGDSYFTNILNTNILVGHVYFDTYETVEQVDIESQEVPPPFQKQKCNRKKNSRQRLKCKTRNRLISQLPDLEPEVTVTRTQVLKSRGLHGFPAVHIEADDSFIGATSGLTFYGRYTTNGSDNREPLPTTFAMQYTQVEQGQDYELVIWREGGASASPIACGSDPSWYPLDLTQAVAFDEKEDAVEIFPEFPIETQVSENILSLIPHEAGWLYLNLNYGSGPRQSWITQRRNGYYSDLGVNALTSGCN